MAVGILVYFLGSAIHEALGHGLAAMAVGLHPQRVSSVDLVVSFHGVPLGKMRLVAAAGCIANLVAAGVALMVWDFAAHWSPPTRFFWWLLGTVNLLIPGGYMMVGGPIGFGDWGDFERGLQPLWEWKAGLAVIGLAISLVGLWWGVRHLPALLPAAPPGGSGPARAVWRLTLGPYLAGGCATVAAAAFNPTSPLLIATAAAASSFGGTAWLVWVGAIVVRRPQRARGGAVGWARDYRWIGAGAAALALYLAVLGPGLPR